MSCFITVIILDSLLLIIRPIKILFMISLFRQEVLTDGYVLGVTLLQQLLFLLL